MMMNGKRFTRNLWTGTKNIGKTITQNLWTVILDIVAVNAAYYLTLLLRFYVNNELRDVARDYYMPAFERFAPYYTVLAILVFIGFRLYGGNLSVSTATDLGYFSEDVYANVAGSTLVLLESNHDPDMLKANPHYNAALKARILGDHGHLSNEACSSALLRLINAGTGNVILGHLSGENNTPTLARKVSSDALAREGIRPGEDIRMEVALRDEVGGVYILKERT